MTSLYLIIYEYVQKNPFYSTGYIGVRRSSKEQCKTQRFLSSSKVFTKQSSAEVTGYDSFDLLKPCIVAVFFTVPDRG